MFRKNPKKIDVGNMGGDKYGKLLSIAFIAFTLSRIMDTILWFTKRLYVPSWINALSSFTLAISTIIFKVMLKIIDE